MSEVKNLLTEDTHQLYQIEGLYGVGKIHILQVAAHQYALVVNSKEGQELDGRKDLSEIWSRVWLEF